TLQGFTITGATYGVGGEPFSAGIEIYQKQDVVIRDCIITGNEHRGISLYWQCSQNIIANNIIENTLVVEWAGAGIVLECSDGNSVRNNTVRNNQHIGILVSGSNNSISENTLEGNGTCGVYICSDERHLPSRYNNVENNVIKGTSVMTDWAAGIHLSHVGDSSISGNTLENNDGFGIQLWCCSNCNVENNVITGTKKVATKDWSGHAIEIPESTYIRIYNNTITYNDGIGIVVNGASWNTVENNLLDGNGVLADWGLNVHSFWTDSGEVKLAQGNVIKNNTIKNTNGGGVVIAWCWDTEVRGNVVQNNTLGIRVDSAEDLSARNIYVVNNTIDGNAYYGIEVRPRGENIVIEGNEVKNTRWQHPTSGYVAGYGIILWGFYNPSGGETGLRGHQVINNYVHDNAFGIYVSPGEECVIVGNRVENNDELGPGIGLGADLYYDGQVYWWVCGRINGGGGIFLNGQRNRVENNTISGNGFAIGIIGGEGTEATVGNVIEGNTVTNNDKATVSLQIEKWEWVEEGGSGSWSPMPRLETVSPGIQIPPALSPRQTGGYWVRTQVIPLGTLTGFGIGIVHARGTVITGNEMSGNGDVGIGLLGFEVPEAGLSGRARDSFVHHNSITGHGEGVRISTYAPNNLFEWNSITNNTSGGTGVRAETATGNVVRYSQIVGNGPYGVANLDSQALDARHNWWGSAGGPGTGGANGVSGNVLYTPWWPSPTGYASVFRIERETGNVFSDGSFFGSGFHAGSADVAEWVWVCELVEPGDVLELDPSRPGYYRKARGPCSPLVAGVVSSQPGVVLGHSEDTEGKALLALMGIVPVKVTDEGGPIRPGDLLVAASTPGYAMRWDPQKDRFCQFIGKALQPWAAGMGLIWVLVMH
ncbi:MAG: right-handed parallel beta-helix repeat-containing protein, partial [Candidatus Hadarchaeum sp.]